MRGVSREVNAAAVPDLQYFLIKADLSEPNLALLLVRNSTDLSQAISIRV